MARRFPPPWTVHDNGSCFYVADREGKQFAYCYYRRDFKFGVYGPGVHTWDEARRLATTIAKLPELLGRAPEGVQAENAGDD